MREYVDLKEDPSEPQRTESEGPSKWPARGISVLLTVHGKIARREGVKEG